jgi:hypothetical protein
MGEKTACLDIAVEELRGVEILEGAEELVHDVALVDVLQNVGAQHGVQIGLHELEHEVNVALVLCLGHVEQPGRGRGKESGVARQQGCPLKPECSGGELKVQM